MQARDTLAKALYGRLFDRLIAVINQSLRSTSSGTRRVVSHSISLLDPGHANAESIAMKYIGILDIYGFENLASNGLEQLFINFANEKLQV